MTLQTDLIETTDTIHHARGNVAHYERRQAKPAYYLERDEAAIAVAQRALMTRHDAGPNETARRAYAERETAADRERIAETAAELLDVECALISMKAELAQATDRRRLLETLAQLTIAGVGVQTAPVALAYANGDAEEEFTL